MVHSSSTFHDSLTKFLAQADHPLPDDLLLDYVKRHFDQRQRYLQLAKKHGSPLYILDTPALKAKALRLKTAFEGVLPHVGIYFAVKSNNHPIVSKAFVEQEFGLDVSSGLELEMALEAEASDIVFSGPGKRDDELQLAVSRHDKVTVLIDSFGELQRLESIAALQKQTVRCGVRLTANPQGLWRKFGIPVEALRDFWALAVQRCPHINLCGLQFHTSWNRSPQPQAAFIQRIGKTIGHMPDHFLNRLHFIDIGGGFWPAEGEWVHPWATPTGRIREALGNPPASPLPHICLPADPIETFAETLADTIRECIFPIRECTICLEPGRWLSNDAVHILISVVDKKAPDLVITDAGTNSIGWERFESDYFPILDLSCPALAEHPCHILGSLCTPHDVWGYCYFGEKIEPGHILLIPNQGAYTYSLRQNFIKPLPKLVAI